MRIDHVGPCRVRPLTRAWHVRARARAVERVTGADIPMPYAANLEIEAIPVPANVINAVQKVCYRS